MAGSGQRSACTFICGPDDYLVGRRASTVWKELSGAIEDPFSCEVISGVAGTVPEVEVVVRRVLEAVQTVSLFGDRKVVWLRDVGFLADTVTGRAEGTRRQVERMCAVIGTLERDAVGLLVSASPVDRRRREFKWFQENTEFHLVGEGKGGAILGQVLQEEAAAMGLRLPTESAELLTAKLRGNARLAMEELHKVATWMETGETVVRESYVADLVPVFGEGDFFEAAEQFFSGDLQEALRALRVHFFSGYEGRSLLTNLQNRLRLLIQMRVLIEADLLPAGRVSQGALEKAAARFGPTAAEEGDKSSVFCQNPWYLSRLAPAAARFTLKRMFHFQEAFVQAFRGLVERPKEEESVLREVFIRCLE